MERLFRNFVDSTLKEKALSIEITDEAKDHLRKMIARPNPYLSEFLFFCLGAGNAIDTILVNESKAYPKTSLVQISPGVYSSSPPQSDFDNLLDKLQNIKTKEFLVFGHTHPTGATLVGNDLVFIAPDESLLIPSSGTKSSGGLTSARDLFTAKLIFEKWPVLPKFGIAAITPGGPKLRIYETSDLAKVKKYRDIDRARQITLTL